MVSFAFRSICFKRRNFCRTLLLILLLLSSAESFHLRASCKETTQLTIPLGCITCTSLWANVPVRFHASKVSSSQAMLQYFRVKNWAYCNQVSILQDSEAIQSFRAVFKVCSLTAPTLLMLWVSRTDAVSCKSNCFLEEDSPDFGFHRSHRASE